MICPPWHVYSTGYDEEVFGAQIMGCLGHESGKFHSSCTFLGIIAGQGIRPEQKGAKTADFDTDFICHLADGLKVFGVALGREVTFEIVVEFNAVEASIFGKLEAFLKVHAVRIGESPEVDRLLHVVAFGGGTSGIRLPGRSRSVLCGDSCRGGDSRYAHGKF